jgi:hypothetical protein
VRGCHCGRWEILFFSDDTRDEGTGMKTRNVLLLGLGLAVAFESSAAEAPGEAAAVKVKVVPPVERPRGVCHFSQPGISVVIEDTTEQACHDRQVQCGQENPGRDGECRARWTISEAKASRARKGKRAGKFEGAPR